MPLVKCLDCGKMVSDRAPSCINCGAPIPSSPLPSFSAAGTIVNDERKGRIAELIGGGFCVIAGFFTLGAFNTHTPLLLHDYRSGPLLTAQTFLTYFIGDLVSLTIGFIFHLVTITAGVIAIVRSRKTRGRTITIAGALLLFLSLIAFGRTNPKTSTKAETMTAPASASLGHKESNSSNTLSKPIPPTVVRERRPATASMNTTKDPYQGITFDRPMTALDKLRVKYPQYNDWTDEELIVGLHQKFYSDYSLEEFRAIVTTASDPTSPHTEVLEKKRRNP